MPSSSARVLFRDQMMCGQRRIRAVTFNGELMRWITAGRILARARLYIPLARHDKNIYRLREICLYTSHIACVRRRLISQYD